MPHDLETRLLDDSEISTVMPSRKKPEEAARMAQVWGSYHDAHDGWTGLDIALVVAIAMLSLVIAMVAGIGLTEAWNAWIIEAINVPSICEGGATACVQALE